MDPHWCIFWSEWHFCEFGLFHCIYPQNLENGGKATISVQVFNLFGKNSGIGQNIMWQFHGSLQRLNLLLVYPERYPLFMLMY